jgi:F0F1-type ATP synthase gamma subunit
MELLDSEPNRLESRLTGVRAVGEVVQAIWALSRAQLPRAEEAVAKGSLYLDWVDGVVERLAGKPAIDEDTPRLVLVLGPERPFASALVHELVAVVRRLRREAPGAIRIAALGTRFFEALEAERDAPELLFHLPGPSSVAEIASVATALATEVTRHAPGHQVELWHPSAQGVRHSVVLGAVRDPLGTPPESYSSPELILADALRESIRGRFHVAIAECLRAEIYTRVIASDRARRAADSRAEELERALRIMTQEHITRELCDLYAGTLAGERR